MIVDSGKLHNPELSRLNVGFCFKNGVDKVTVSVFIMITEFVIEEIQEMTCYLLFFFVQFGYGLLF